jgi:hypothetical protein
MADVALQAKAWRNAGRFESGPMTRKRAIVVIHRGPDPERHRHALRVQAPDHGLHPARVLHRRDLRQQRREGRRARGVDGLLVHARRVEVADLLLDAVGRPIAALRHLLETLGTGRRPNVPAPMTLQEAKLGVRSRCRP